MIAFKSKFSIFFDYSYFNFSTNLVSSKFASIAPDLSSSRFCRNCSFVGATFPLQEASRGCQIVGLDVKVNLHPKSASQVKEGRFHLVPG